VTDVFAFRAGTLDDPAASLSHPLIATVHALRPAARPGFDDTVFCSLTFAAAALWAAWARVHSPAGVAVHAIAAVSDRVWIYPVDLWEDINDATTEPQIAAMAARYWQAGMLLTDDVDIDSLTAEDPYRWEALVPVADIGATQLAIQGPSADSESAAERPKAPGPK
jgi:hypothetical protein